MKIDKKDMNLRIRPQDDFYHHACGGWLKKNTIPETESRWGSFLVLRDENRKRIHKILRDLTHKKSLKKGSSTQLLRDFYISGMNTKEINRLGISPLLPYFKKIEKITQETFQKTITNFHKDGIDFLFAPYVGLDDKNNNKMILHIEPVGLGLPEREYYLSQEKKFITIRKKYVQHITNLFKLVDVPPSKAREGAENILFFETELAKVLFSAEDRHDIKKIYNKKKATELQRLMPIINWNEYFKTIGARGIREVLVPQPKYLKKLNVLLKKTPLTVLQDYLYFTIISGNTGLLPENFSNESFSFYGKVLQGLKKKRPRWQRVYGTIDALMTEAIGEEYRKRYFSENAKEVVEDLIGHIKDVLKERIKTRKWMTPQTKKKALKKLEAFRAKIGYPEKPERYPKNIKKDAYFENVYTLSRFHFKKNIAKLHKKIDREEWHMGAHVVNAYYWANQNEIVFPAGILQPPFFHEKADMALNYGATGTVIGHEITHGFDNSGRLFDHKANYKEWWTAKDRKEFEKRTKVLVDHYNSFTAVDELKVNGKLTLGENIADLGGIILAYHALQKHMEEEGRLRDIDGLTPEQRFFYGWVSFETTKTRDEMSRILAVSDPHAPSYTRVNGPLAHFGPFYDAFNVKRGDMMYRPESKRADIW